MAAGVDEGRAMIELVHDVAPGSPQAFYTAFEGHLDFAQGIRDLAAAGCKIITDDVFYLAEPFFQAGPIEQAIDDVVNNGGVTLLLGSGKQRRTSYQSTYASHVNNCLAGYMLPTISVVVIYVSPFYSWWWAINEIIIASSGMIPSSPLVVEPVPRRIWIF